MPSTNVIRAGDEWAALVNVRRAIGFFKEDTSKYTTALDKYNNIYIDLLREVVHKEHEKW